MFEKIREIICEKLEISEDKVNLETSFEDLGADSLDLFEVIMDIEEEFDIKLDDPTKIKTVNDAVKYVENMTK
ncbi:acyl carrier protein [Clostridium mediterraneense]|uniref:acyl carrier protein n=1 Tax=Clostridium mediterraneense TaxID=1805472 RepID=UPI00082F562A|nr:acyl carrier protein [Clostridium mediterraneense]